MLIFLRSRFLEYALPVFRWYYSDSHPARTTRFLRSFGLAGAKSGTIENAADCHSELPLSFSNPGSPGQSPHSSPLFVASYHALVTEMILPRSSFVSSPGRPLFPFARAYARSSHTFRPSFLGFRSCAFLRSPVPRPAYPRYYPSMLYIDIPFASSLHSMYIPGTTPQPFLPLSTVGRTRRTLCWLESFVGRLLVS